MDTFLSLIQAAAAVCIPVVAVFVISYVRSLSNHTETRTNKMILKQCLDELEGAARAAVAKTSQTFVDSLKESGTFTGKAQTAALHKAKQTAIEALAPATKNFLRSMYDNYEDLLEAKIEEAVRAGKPSSNNLSLDEIAYRLSTSIQQSYAATSAFNEGDDAID